MFQKAVSIASEFTFPLVMSRKTAAGQCSSSIGTFVVINNEGWVVTAGHILHQWVKLLQGAEATQMAQAKIQSIKDDKSLSNKERARALAAGPVVGGDDTERCSMWVGIPGTQLSEIGFVPVEAPGWGEIVDFGVAKLTPFNPNDVKTYPVFKDPKKDFEPGRSLCKLGFPFHQFRPTWDASKKSFELPAGALPMPRFPIEGIFTRVSEIMIEGQEKPDYPIRYVETSTPGLRGQSGGPTFDVHGSIWAIQAKTSSLSLGLGQNQFLHVGLGVHPDTMFPILDATGVKYQVSAY